MIFFDLLLAVLSNFVPTCVRILQIYGQKCTHFIDDEALLLMVKFSAKDANELSRSPVNTFPVFCGCAGTGAPGIIGCEAPIKPLGTLVAAPPVGFKTSPNGSKPFMFKWCYLWCSFCV